MTNKEKTSELKKEYYDMLRSIGGHALDHVLLDMASWKDNEFMTALTETDIKDFPSYYEFVEYIRKRLNIEALCQTKNL